MKLDNQREIETAMAEVRLHPGYAHTKAEYHRILAVLGISTDDEVADENIALVILAARDEFVHNIWS